MCVSELLSMRHEVITTADAMSGTGVGRDWNAVYGHLE